MSTAELFGLDGAEAPPARSQRREPYFQAWWFEPSSGERLRRASRLELREAYRLLAKHRDLWERR